MSDTIVLNKKNEYFLSIATQDMHSFIMLGVVTTYGEPKLLARIGQTADVNPNPTLKAICSGVLARIADEGIHRYSQRITNINYQAYAINYEQLKEFLGMISEIETEQLKNPKIQAGIKFKYGNDTWDKGKIKCYIPIQENQDNDLVTFEYNILKEFKFAADEALKAKVESKVTPKIASGVQQVYLTNTCRTAAKNIVEAVLGFTTDISKYFFISPRYESKLVAGEPEKASFYILPLPPNTVNVSLKQTSILKKLYKRMEEIPKLNPGDPKTRAKFNGLKAMYTEIAGEIKLSAKDLFGKIIEHEKNNQHALFAKRSPNFLSELFSIFSSTQKMFNRMKDELTKHSNKFCS